MINSLIYGLNEKLALPKIIVFIFEDDIIKHKTLHTTDPEGLTDMYTRVLKWFATNIDRTIAAFKDYIPDRCKRNNIPRILLMSPALNVSFIDNDKRKKFGKSLNAVAKLHDNMSCLQLRQGWDEQDQRVYMHDKGFKRWTTEGLVKYWAAVDKCIQFCDTSMEKKSVNRNRFYNPQTRYDYPANARKRDDLRWHLNKPYHSQYNY